MRRRWKILLLGVCGVVSVIALCFFCLREKEPSYNGRTLSEWLRRYESAPIRSRAEATKIRIEATEAVRAIGATNVVPVLLRWMDEKDPVYCDSVRAIGFKIGGPFGWALADWSENRRAYQRHPYEVGFVILEGNLTPALRLIEKRFETSLKDAYNLSSMIETTGTNALNYFVQVIQRGGTNVQRKIAIEAIGKMGYKLGTNAMPAVRPLLDVVKHDDVSTRAIIALGRLQLCPHEVVPVLSNKLYSVNVGECAAAVESLGRFYDKARCVLPALQRLLDSNSYVIRRATTNAINEIVPGEFPNGYE